MIMSEETDVTKEDATPLVFQKAKEKFPDAVLDVSEAKGELTIVVGKDSAYELLEYVKTDTELSYDFLVDVTAVDYSAMEDVLMKYDYARFMVVYHLYSFNNKTRLRVKTPVHEKEASIRSIASLWKGANWLERETYDMFGITFDNHPDLRRILMPDDFEDYPLRKDYPVRGRGERESFNFERQNK
jgi:NADH-quinone oxidoreductase subunit C